MSDVGFMTMGRVGGDDEVRPIGVGMLGYAFMGKAHSNAYKTLAYMTWPPPLLPQLVAIAGRSEEAVAEAARRYGFAEHATDWKALVGDDRVELFDNAGPNNLHAEPTIAAAEAGKHVICEKPLGRDAAESYETWQRVAATGVKHMCAFNYRFVPAVRLDHLDHRAVAHRLPAADRHRQVEPLTLHGIHPRLQRRPLCAAGRIGAYGLVPRHRHGKLGVHLNSSSLWDDVILARGERAFRMSRRVP